MYTYLRCIMPMLIYVYITGYIHTKRTLYILRTHMSYKYIMYYVFISYTKRLYPCYALPPCGLAHRLCVPDLTL